VLSFFKFSCVHAQVAIGGFQQFLKLVEAHRIIYRERAHNSETDRFVNQPVQVRRAALSRAAAQALRFGVAYCFIVSSHHSSLQTSVLPYPAAWIGTPWPSAASPSPHSRVRGSLRRANCQTKAPSTGGGLK